ncbi:MAG: M48 family metallopeptidase [Synoicihabitans sp.]
MLLNIVRSVLLGGAILWSAVGCTTVPETGRSQLIMVSSQEEAQMGLAAFQQIKEEEKVSTNVMAIDRVNRVGRRIAASVGRSLPDAKWEFVVFESEDLNAFALPGGKVGVYTGLLDLAESDDELAAVMGHEIAHVTSRHSAERMSQQMVAGLTAAGAEVYMESQDVDHKNRAIARAVLGVGTTVGVMLPFSRLHESEADAIGLKFAAGAGYDPRAAITFWQKMKAASEGEGRPPEFLSTHPSPDNRIERLKALAPEVMPLYRQAKKKFDAEEMKPIADREIGANPGR